MNRKQLEKSWAITTSHLMKAFELLPTNPLVGSEGETVEQFSEYIEHNELELALDELEGLGGANEVESSFWSQLLSAAREMKLGNHIKRYEAKLSSW